MKEEITGVATPTDIAPALPGEPKIVLTEKQSRNFLAKIDRSSHPLGCWTWTAFKDNDGYGGVRLWGQNHRAHRISYRIHKGAIPEGMLVCHSCDNRLCVNPDHLWVGTAQQNTTDMVNKGRHKGEYPGEKHHGAKLTEKEILEIRSAWSCGDIMQKDLAIKYGVGRMQISRIVRGERWKHLPV